MPGDRLRRILAELGAGGDGLWAARLCAVFPQIGGVTGAGVMLMSGGARAWAAEAFSRLRRYARSRNLRLTDVANRIVGSLDPQAWAPARRSAPPIS